MAEITVFEVTEESVTLNKSQKQLEYEDLESKAMLPVHHYKTLFELDEFLERKIKPSSDVLSIMLKWILQYCIPLIAKKEATSISANNPTSKSANSNSSIYGIPLQSENVTYGVCDNKYCAIPAGEQFQVVGIKIPAVFVKHYSWSMLVHTDHISNEDISNTGQFGLYDMQTEKYTQQRSGFTHPGYPSVGENVITFVDDTQVGKIISTILNYIDFIEEYYNINYPILRYDLIKPEILESGKKWYIINGRVVDKEISDLIASATHKKSKLIDDFSIPVLHVLDKAQPSKFGKSFYMDILYMLDKNRLTHAYNVGNQLGVDDGIFKAEFALFSKKLEYDNIFNRETQEAYTYYNRQAKKRIIALNKYNIADLDILDSKQLKVVELEYKKTLMSEDVSTVAIQKAFYKLRKTFNDVDAERLNSAIKDLEKIISTNELSADNLLPSGDCPHVYQYAKILQKDFGKPWLGSNLKEYLIQNFALPSDTAGYFCKLCGEKLVESDNVGAVTFMGLPGSIGMSANEEDALQTMIWKEAMYIVSSNVRFFEPTPLKPLVSSLANGLKNVIAIEEAKLFRSKTSTADMVKDTLNLYASIYIYAALCAVMIANPGKLTFARDKPGDSAEKERKISDIEQQKGSKKEDDPDNGNDTMDNLGNNTDNLGKSDYVEDNGNDGDTEDLGTSEFVEDKDDKDSTLVTGKGGKFHRNTSRSKNASKKTNIKVDKKTNIKVDKKTTKKTNIKTNIKADKKTNRKHRYVSGGKMVITDDTKKASAHIIKNALVLLIISKEAIISRAKNINVQIIRNIFSTAFKWATDHAKPMHFDREVDKQIHQDPILLDPFYTYIHYSRKMEYFKDGGFVPRINDVYNMLGRHKDSVINEMKEKNTDIYATIRDPKPWIDDKTTGNLDNYESFYAKFAYESFLSMFEYIKSRIYDNSFIPRHVQVSDYLDKYSYLLKDEKRITYHRVVESLRPNASFELVNDLAWKYGRFDADKLDLAQHFCPTGENHKIGSFIYQDAAGKMHDYTKKDINEWLTNNAIDKIESYNNMTLVNERCSNCKNLIRDAKSSNKSSKALSDMFKTIDDILAFYQYYDTRCPAGNLHDIIDSVCSKCKFHSDNGKKSDVAYYNKYVAGFRKIQLEQQQITIKSLQYMREGKLYKSPPVVDKFTYTLKKTSEWSTISGIKYNIIVNIGLSEGIKYPEIEQAKNDPSKDEYSYKTRGMKLKGYIYNTLRDYMLFINHASVVDLPLQLKEIISSQKRTDFSDMPMFADFQKLDESFKYSLSPNDYCNFLQEYLANIMCSINAFPPGKMLVSLFTQSIISKELLLSKARPVFYKVDITTAENGSEDEAGVSGDDWAGRAVASSASEGEFAEEAEVETYENDIDNEGFDVEDADAIWEPE